MEYVRTTAHEQQVIEINAAVVEIAGKTQEALNQLLPLLEKGDRSRQLELARDNLESAVMRLKAHGNKGRFVE